MRVLDTEGAGGRVVDGVPPISHKRHDCSYKPHGRLHKLYVRVKHQTKAMSPILPNAFPSPRSIPMHRDGASRGCTPHPLVDAVKLGADIWLGQRSEHRRSLGRVEAQNLVKDLEDVTVDVVIVEHTHVPEGVVNRLKELTRGRGRGVDVSPS